MALSPELVHRRLREASRHFRWSRAGRFLVSGAAVSLFFLILFLLCDTQFHVGAFVRWAGFLGVVAPLAVGVALALPAWMRPLPELAIARRIEVAAPHAGNALVNAVQFDQELRPGSAMRAAVFEELADPFPGVNWGEVFDLRLLTRLGMALGMTAAVVFGWALVRPAAFTNSVARVFLPAGNIAPLTRTQLETLTPGNATVVHGSAVDVAAHFSGEIPRTAWVRYREAGGSWRRELMNREVGTPLFTYQWKDVSQPIQYYIEAGDLETPVYNVVIRVRTAIKLRTAEIQPPAYSGLPRRTVSGFSVLEGILPGSNVVFTLDFNNPVKTLAAIDDKGQAVSATAVNDRRWTLAVPVRTNRVLTLALQDGNNANATETLPITVKHDAPPNFTITDPVEGREIVAAPSTASLGVQFTVTDDYGLSSVGLYRSSDEKPDATLIQEWPAAAGQKTFSASVKIPLGQYAKPDDKQITFCLVARDRNDATGPGITRSRPLTVSLDSAQKVRQQADDATAKLEASLRELLKLQRTNLQATEAANDAPGVADTALTDVVNRQAAVGDMAGAVSASAEELAPEVRGTLRGLTQAEMPAALLALRNAAVAPASARGAMLATAGRLERLILAKLQASPDQAAEAAQRAEIQNLIAGVDGLLRDEKEILRDTGSATPEGDKLSERQDRLADQSVKVRKDVELSAGDSSLGDTALRAGLKKIADMFGEFKINEGMLTAADVLGSKAFPKATAQETALVASLQKMVDVLSLWQVAQANAKADELRKATEDLKAKIAALAELQRDVLEKSKELARKDQFSKDDLATAAEIVRTKDLMGKVVEGMLTDANIFPEMIVSNELKTLLSSIFEDVRQEDLDAIAKGKLKPGDLPVQKEDSLLAGIEAMKKIPPDMEMSLPKTSNTGNWLLENFDKTEIPKLDNLPLPDELTDLIGTLQKEQEDISDKVQGAASNQVIKAMQQGAAVLDGPQSGYSAQGKSGNQKPLDIEQGGRSAGGREGESNGEMVGKVADDLEGRKTHVRRTNDALQSGNVEDPSGKAADAKATGGGKASGFSQREGMDGDAPVRASEAPRQAANSALAVAQALLAKKTSRKAAQAELLYLRADKLQGVAGLMEESQSALNEGRLADFQGLHRKIMTQLQAAQGEITNGKVLSLATHEAARTDDKPMLGGGEGEAPAPYKDRVADYYRSLADGK